MNYLLENLNTAIAKAAELTDDPKLLRHLGAIKNAARQLAEHAAQSSSSTDQERRRIASGSARSLDQVP